MKFILYSDKNIIYQSMYYTQLPVEDILKAAVFYVVMWFSE